MFPMAKASTRWLHVLVLLTLIGGLMLGACSGGELNVDLDMGGGGGDGGGSGSLSESNLFILLIVVFVVIAALAMVSGR